MKKFTILKGTIQVFSVFIRLCNHHHNLMSEHLHYLKRSFMSISNHVPLLLFCSNDLLIFLSQNLPIVDISIQAESEYMSFSD